MEREGIDTPFQWVTGHKWTGTFWLGVKAHSTPEGHPKSAEGQRLSHVRSTATYGACSRALAFQRGLHNRASQGSVSARKEFLLKLIQILLNPHTHGHWPTGGLQILLWDLSYPVPEIRTWPAAVTTTLLLILQRPPQEECLGRQLYPTPLWYCW